MKILEFNDEILNIFESIFKDENYELIVDESYGCIRPIFYTDIDTTIDIEAYIEAFLETIDLSDTNYSDGVKKLIRRSYFSYYDDKIGLNSKRPFGNSNYIKDIIECTGCKKEDSLNIFTDVILALKNVLCNFKPIKNLIVIENKYKKYQIIDNTQYQILKNLNII